MDSDLEIISCYDSHVHWLMTGEKKSFLDLEKLSSLEFLDFAEIEKKAFKGSWLMGFGWREDQFIARPHFSILDKLSLKFPICFIKKDAHSCLLNSVGIQIFIEKFEKDKDLGKFLERDEANQPTGILKESGLYALLGSLPSLTSLEIENYLLEGQNYFLKNGYSHIRDMTCSLEQWKVLVELENKKQLKIQAEINFNFESLQELENEILPFIQREKEKKLSHLQIQGIKLFYDGSLSSETALLSEPYLGTLGPTAGAYGLRLWRSEEVKAAMRLAWGSGLQISVHTLGDQAVSEVVQCAKELQKEKITGILNLEHVELVSSKTVSEMKSLHVKCHMQPSHWLSDKKWIKSKINSTLMKNLFQWEQLRKAKVPLFFGSDSPIEEANVALLLEALRDSEQNGILKFNDEPERFLSHPTLKNGLSKFKNKVLQEVYLNNECVFKRQ